MHMTSRNHSRDGSCETDDVTSTASEKKPSRRTTGSDRQSISSFDSELDFYTTLTRSSTIVDDNHLVVRLPYKLLPHHFVMQCYSSNTFKIGDIVWAKAHQLPAWPGEIITHTDRSKDNLQPPPPHHVRECLFMFPW